ncbi:hypothetical protein [Gabonia massiliensis]|nr:hypothetical protein [Gabonia massiliensis]
MAQDLDRYAGQINVGVDCIHANIDKCLDVHGGLVCALVTFTG